MSIIIDETRDGCESCGTSCCPSCAERLLVVCNDCGGLTCVHCRFHYGNEWYCCPLSVQDKEPCDLCGETHSPYCRPLNLSLCEECQAYNAQFTRPIAAIRCLFDRDLIVFDAASYDETVTTLEELHEAATDPKVKTALGKLLYLANQMPLLSETELGKQITKLF
jgi:hypothetical protein